MTSMGCTKKYSFSSQDVMRARTYFSTLAYKVSTGSNVWLMKYIGCSLPPHLAIKVALAANSETARYTPKVSP